MGWASTGRDESISQIAEGQHGLVTFEQLRHAGLSASAIRKRSTAGKLHRVHRGVYSVGHRPLDIDAEKRAAVLACGDGALLSHKSAAALWRIRAEVGRPFDVTAPNRRGRIPSGIRAHRHGSLQRTDHSSFRGIPCTTVARTLLDLAADVTLPDLRRAVEEAEARLTVAEWRVIRCTWNQVFNDPAGLARTIKALLSPTGLKRDL